MILPLMILCVSLLGLAFAQDPGDSPPEPIRLPLEEVPGHLEVPRDERGAVAWEWQFFAQANTELTMRRFQPPTVLVSLGFLEGFQPDLERLDGPYIRHLLEERLDWEGYTLGADITPRVEAHPVLGQALVADIEAIYTPPAPPPPAPPEPGAAPAPPTPPAEAAKPIRMNLRVMLFGREAGIGFVVAESPGALDPARPELDGAPPEVVVDLPAVTEDVLGMLTLKQPPLPEAELPRGRVEMEAGYALTLPEGWRALTHKEMNLLSTERIADGPYEGLRAARVFVEPSTAAPLRFSCQVYSTKSRPIEVLHHEKSGEHADNYRRHARVMLKRGRFSISSGGSKDIIAAAPPTELLPVTVPEEAEGELRTLDLGDRDAYTWRVQGTRGVDEPVTVAAYYTAWDNLGLDCFAIAGPDQQALLDAFDQAMATLEILDREEHPMVLSFLSRYRRWWPYSHPALQLYWLIIPLFLLAMLPMFREWWETRS